MKVLDLFCGRGGWSKPFIEDGDEVWGMDIKNYDYPGRFIESDIREMDGYGFGDMDFIIGSDPCTEYSQAKAFGVPFRESILTKKRDIGKGLELTREFFRFIRQAKPRFWARENVTASERWWPNPPQWRFRISARGDRSLWTNLPIHLTPEFKFRRHFGVTRETRERLGKTPDLNIRSSSRRAEIPYPVARFIADQVKATILGGKPEEN